MNLLLLLALALPSAESIIQRAIEIDKAQTPIQNQYTYTEEIRNQQVEKDGKLGAVDTKTFDVIFLEGETFRKLILVDGKPLPPDKQKKVDQEMEKARDERRKARRSGFGHIERTVQVGGLTELLKYFDSRVTGEETVRGHLSWVIESTPKRDYKPNGKEQEQIMSWSHRTWFDQQEGAQVQSQDTAIRPVNGFQTGSEHLWEYDKGSEDCWLIRKITSKSDLQFYKMIHGRVNTIQTFTNYKKFDVASTITTGDEVKK
jgi:hypothetical protein